MKDYEGYKIKLYPTDSQKQILKRYIGACRFVYNYFLVYSENIVEQKLNDESIVKDSGRKGKLRPKKLEMTAELTRLKHTNEYSWLNNIPVSAMNYEIFHLNQAYEFWFNDNMSNNKPKLKKKTDCKQSFSFRNDRLRITENSIKVDGIKMEIPCSNHNIPHKHHAKNNVMDNLEQEVYTPTISFDGDDFWFSCQIKTIKYDIDYDEIDRHNNHNRTRGIGIDLGVKTTATCSDGTTWNIEQCVKERKKLANKQRKYFKKYVNPYYRDCDVTKPKFSESQERETKRCQKARRKIRKVYRKISNKCMSSVYEFVNSVISKNPSYVVMEDISSRNTAKDVPPPVRKKIAKSYWYTIREVMQYKCRWDNIPFYLADSDYPSTQRCHCCKNILTGNDKLRLGDRVYVCMICGYKKDRDFNASLNLEEWIDIMDNWEH